jgi:AhpD family alkylhydroperoxidase
MARTDVESEIRETLGLVPTFFAELPEQVLESEWRTFADFQLAETAIPNKYKELIGLAVSGATRCRYCVYFHTEAARLFGATDEEINEAAFMAKHTMGWSTYLNAKDYDYDEFKREFDKIAEHVGSGQPAGASV